jgi:hypothetical protein
MKRSTQIKTAAAIGLGLIAVVPPVKSYSRTHDKKPNDTKPPSSTMCHFPWTLRKKSGVDASLDTSKPRPVHTATRQNDLKAVSRLPPLVTKKKTSNTLDEPASSNEVGSQLSAVIEKKPIIPKRTTSLNAFTWTTVQRFLQVPRNDFRRGVIVRSGDRLSATSEQAELSEIAETSSITEESAVHNQSMAERSRSRSKIMSHLQTSHCLSIPSTLRSANSFR